jgi:branched-chain amino acid transport system substrate-binding protein
MKFRIPILLALLVAAPLLGACDDPRVAGVFGRSQPTTQAPPPPVVVTPPAPMARPPEPAPPVAVAPLPAPTPAPRVAVSPTGAPRVALLVPLSGPNAAVGRSLLDAATLALYDVADDDFVLLPRDTKGTPEGALEAFDWALEQGARLVVGPLLSAEVQALTPRAREAGIAMLAFSNDQAAASSHGFVLGIAPQAAIRRMVEFARAQGLEKFVALVPNNALGHASEAAFREALDATEGELVRVERYDPGTLDASPAVRRVGQVGPPPPRAARGEAAREPPELDFEAILIPDFGDRLAQIASQLHLHEIDPARIKFLGIPLWDDARTYREPSLLGGWFAAPPPEGRRNFERQYREVYGRPPPRVATLAYDAVALAAVLARDKGPNGADYSLGVLTNPAGFAGIEGIFRLTPTGQVERGYAVLEVQRGNPRALSPAPDTFEAPAGDAPPAEAPPTN